MKTITALTATAALAGAVALAGPAHAQEKFTICHATGSTTNPYVQITIPGPALLQAGHGDHEGDIHPEITFQHRAQSNTIPARNWDTQGQAIYAAGCVLGLPDTEVEAPVKTPTPVGPVIIIPPETVDQPATETPAPVTPVAPVVPAPAPAPQAPQPVTVAPPVPAQQAPAPVAPPAPNQVGTWPVGGADTGVTRGLNVQTAATQR